MISLKRIFCTCCLLLSVWAVFAQGPSKWKALEKPLNFYLANDLGRNGYYDQKPIAELMGQMAENVDETTMNHEQPQTADPSESASQNKSSGAHSGFRLKQDD